jgi:hypothetical protein
MAFWDIWGILLFQFLDPGATENANHYCTTQWHLKEAMGMKHLDLLMKKLILLHGNANSNTAGITVPLLEQTCWECLAQPPHRPHLVSSNYQPTEETLQRRTLP